MAATFRYFVYPHQFSTYQEQPERCGVCGNVTSGYAGPFYGPLDIKFVCEGCLSSGRLRRLDISTNHSDIAALRVQLSALHPELSEDERERIAQDRTEELEYQTPLPVTWQELVWPAHCGDYCRFLKEIGQPELARLSPDGDGPAFLLAHAEGITDAGLASQVWADMRPDSPIDNSEAYALGVYLFRCLTCGEHMLCWDYD
jgi:uncharacterized protein CbrC (UPF0167 family)